MCAMGPKARSSLRSSSVVWSRARTSDRKVTQKCWSSFVSENVTPSESSKPITTCPMPLLILPQRSSPARPKPSIASKNVFSVPRAKRVWPTMSSLSASAPNEVRNWKGWHHHQILSLIATWFLVTEARRGKKIWTPAITVPQIREGISSLLHCAYRCGIHSRILHEREQWLIRNELARLYHWKQRNRLAPLNINKKQI